MRIAKAIIITAMFGIAIGLFPKTSSARDVSVGISLGIPFPVFEAYHILPSPPPAFGFYNHRPYHRKAYAKRPHFRYYKNHEYRGKRHGHYKREKRRHRYEHKNDCYDRKSRRR